MTYKSNLLIALFLCAQTQIIAQNINEESLDEVVVTDSRFELNVKIREKQSLKSLHKRFKITKAVPFLN